MDAIAAAEITGLVLAGGRGTRMGGRDKGLELFRGVPMAVYAVKALGSVASRVLISANRNLAFYGSLGCQVVPDLEAGFQGPLAGLLSGLRAASTEFVLAVPCDAPLVTGELLARLCASCVDGNAEVCTASDGRRLHPVFLLVRRDLADDLDAFLSGGERKVQAWIERHRWCAADFSDSAGLFQNINTLGDLAEMQAPPVG